MHVQLLKHAIIGLTAIGCAVVSSPAALAHHSAAMFDRNKTVVLKGKLTSYQFVAPHAWISLDTTPKGKAKGARWDVECTSASAMRRLGITPQNLKPGDVITVKVNPLKDGRNGGSLVEITLADGTVKSNTYADIPYGQLR